MVQRAIVGAHGATYPTASTTYFIPLGALGSATGTTEAQARYPWRGAGRLTNLYVRAGFNSRSDASVITLRVNGANSALSASLAAAGASASDLANVVTVADGDLLCLAVTLGSGTGSLGLRSVTLQFETDGQVFTHLCGQAAAPASSQLQRWVTPLGGQMILATPEAETHIRALEDCTLSNLIALTTTNGASNACVLTSRKNTGAGGQSVSIPAGSTSMVEDTSNADTVADGDVIDVQKAATTGGVSLAITGLRYEGQVTGRAPIGSGGSGTAGGGTTNYGGLFGPPLFGTSEGDAQSVAPFDARLSRFSCNVVSNSSTTTCTLRLRINGSNAAQSLSIGAGQTGIITPSGATDDVVAGDLLSVQASGQDANVTFSWIGALVTDLNASDMIVAISTTDQQFVDVTTWLDTIPDNQITVTVAGDVSMRVWGYETLQTDGQTRTWVDRKLREYLVAVTDGAAVGHGTWTFSALDGPNETGNLSTFVVALAVQATPVATITVGGQWDKAGYGGFPLSRFGSANDWVLNTQSDTTNNPLALWDGTVPDAARIAWASSVSPPTGTYGGVKKVASPTTGQAAYTATVSSSSLGISNRVITFNVDGDIVKVGPCPGRDSPTVGSLNQLIDVVRNGRSDGTMPWGQVIVCNEGIFNSTAVNQDWNPKQPGPTISDAPQSPFGTNASPSWDYADGWNPRWITIKGDLPGIVFVEGEAPIHQTQIQSGRINVASLTNQTLGYRFTNLDLCKGSNASGASLFIRDGSSTVQGTHKVAIDHCTRGNITLNDDGDYSDMLIVAYNDLDNAAANFTATSLGIIGKDSQIIGNVLRNYVGDILNSFIYCSTIGNGRTKTSWNVSVDKKLELGAHSDFYQTHAFSAKQYINTTTFPPGSDIDIGEFVGNWSTKGKGRIFTVDDVNYVGVYVPIAGQGPFIIGETINNAAMTKSMVVESLPPSGVSRAGQGQVLPTSGGPFTVGETVTGATSGTTGVVSAVTTWAGANVTLADVGKTPGDCQGFYNGAATAPVTGAEHFRSDINHIYIMAGWITEGLSSYGIMRLPPPADSADVVIVNNFVTPAWGTISEVGTGGYYDAGRFAISAGTIFPTGSFISSISSLGARIIGRNVFMCGPGFTGISVTHSNDLIGSDFGSPTDGVTAVPTQVLNAMVDPAGTATRSCLGDIVEDFTATPSGILTTQGTPVDFGPIVPEIDYERHTYDRTALAQL